MRAVTALAMALLFGLAGCSGDDAGVDTVAEEAPDPGSGAARAGIADGAAEEAPAPPGPAPHGTFVDPGTNPFVSAAEDGLSTFALDVDTASYTVARAWLEAGSLPDPASVRVEEYVNAFDPGYAPPVQGPFALRLDAAPHPHTPNLLLRVGVQSAVVPDEARPDAALTFVIDRSGSMAEGDRMGTVKDALRRLVAELRDTDKVAIVVYNETASRILPPTPGFEREAILAAIDELEPGGSTNLDAGLTLGYATALGGFEPEAINRVVLASDGVANTGATDWRDILERVRGAVDRDIQLVTIGVGMGPFNDHLLEQLADNGDGFYAYVDSPAEAERLFADDLTGTLLTVAKDARIQVAFDPTTVADYRLIGFENRAIADDDFRDDTVDAGEIGAGHHVTALYEIVPVTGADGPLATAMLRWLDPGDGEGAELAATIATADVTEDAAPRFRLLAEVATWAELLHDGRHLGEVTLADVAGGARALLPAFTDDPQVAEWVDLVERSLAVEG